MGQNSMKSPSRSGSVLGENQQRENGIALSRLHDGAFDRGLITFDEQYRLVLSDRLRAYLPHESLEANFLKYQGKALNISADVPPPKQEYLAVHRKEWGFR